MAKSPQDVLSELKKGHYSPIYFLQGEEPYYIDKISDYIEEHAIEESQKGFNQMVIYGKDTDMDQVMLNAKRFPMMSDRQLVLVKEAQDIKDLGREQGAKMLEAYVKNPLSSTILVFCYRNKTLDGRKAVSKAIDKHAVLVTAKKIYDNQVPAWITDYVKEKGNSIDQKAVMMLVESVGANLSKLSNEINKVCINFDESTEINATHIDKYIGISKDYNVFELQKALANKNILKANKIISYFASDPKGNPIIPMLVLLFQYFTKVLQVHATKDKSDNAVAQLIGVHRFFVKDYMIAARNYKPGKILYIIKSIKEADLQTKGVNASSIPEHQIMRELVFKILH